MPRLKELLPDGDDRYVALARLAVDKDPQAVLTLDDDIPEFFELAKLAVQRNARVFNMIEWYDRWEHLKKWIDSLKEFAGTDASWKPPPEPADDEDEDEDVPNPSGLQSFDKVLEDFWWMQEIHDDYAVNGEFRLMCSDEQGHYYVQDEAELKEMYDTGVRAALCWKRRNAADAKFKHLLPKVIVNGEEEPWTSDVDKHAQSFGTLFFLHRWRKGLGYPCKLDFGDDLSSERFEGLMEYMKECDLAWNKSTFAAHKWNTDWMRHVSCSRWVYHDMEDDRYEEYLDKLVEELEIDLSALNNGECPGEGAYGYEVRDMLTPADIWHMINELKYKMEAPQRALKEKGEQELLDAHLAQFYKDTPEQRVLRIEQHYALLTRNAVDRLATETGNESVKELASTYEKKYDDVDSALEALGRDGYEPDPSEDKRPTKRIRSKENDSEDKEDKEDDGKNPYGLLAKLEEARLAMNSP